MEILSSEKFNMYGGDVILEYREVISRGKQKHIYLVNDKIIDGVTTILDIVNKPALAPWQMNKFEERLLANLDNASKESDTVRVGDVLNWILSSKKEPEEIRKMSADIGSSVHSWIENFAKGNTLPIPEREYVKASVEAFIEWNDAHDIKYIESEFPIYSRKYNYAGRVDLLVEMDGKKYIGDIKTSSGIFPEYMLQTAAYQHAFQEERGIEIDGRIIIHCGKDGKIETLITDEFEHDFGAFVNALRLRTGIDEIKRKIKK